MHLKIALGLMLMLGVAVPMQADTLTLSGFLNDQANPALVWSNLGPAQFGNDNNIANNVAVYDINLAAAGAVEFLSQGYAFGGIDPYFTLFSGKGASATFLGSNYDQAFSTGGDFDLTFSLAAGDYTVAIGDFANMSLAENSGGALGEGFTYLGSPDLSRSWFYQLQVITTPGATPVPEPTACLLILPGLAAIWLNRRRSGRFIRK